jgi:hypothetical protein
MVTFGAGLTCYLSNSLLSNSLLAANRVMHRGVAAHRYVLHRWICGERHSRLRYELIACQAAADVAGIRKKLELSQSEFAARFGMVIDKEPAAVRRALEKAAT